MRKFFLVNQCKTCSSYFNFSNKKLKDLKIDTQLRIKEEQRIEKLHEVCVLLDKTNKAINNEKNPLVLAKLNFQKTKCEFLIGKLKEERILYKYMHCPVCDEKVYLQ